MERHFKVCTNQGLKQIPRANGINGRNLMSRGYQQEVANNILPTAGGWAPTTSSPEEGSGRRHYWNLQKVALSIPGHEARPSVEEHRQPMVEQEDTQRNVCSPSCLPLQSLASAFYWLNPTGSQKPGISLMQPVQVSLPRHRVGREREGIHLQGQKGNSQHKPFKQKCTST